MCKEFRTNGKSVLPLVPQRTTMNKKEDLAQVDLISNPANVKWTKVNFVFEILEDGTETPHEIIHWFQNGERVFTGLKTNAGTLRKKMTQQFACWSVLSGFNAALTKPVETAGQGAASAATELVACSHCMNAFLTVEKNQHDAVTV